MSTKYAIVGGKLIDGTGAEPVENSLVLVDDNGKIEYAGTMQDLPEGVEVIDAAGKTVLPGLIDTHLHFSGNLTDDDTDWVMQPLLEKQAVAVKQAYDCLTHGLTTVCEIGRFGIQIRDCIDKGVFKARAFWPPASASAALPATVTPTTAPRSSIRNPIPGATRSTVLGICARPSVVACARTPMPSRSGYRWRHLALGLRSRPALLLRGDPGRGRRGKDGRHPRVEPLLQQPRRCLRFRSLWLRAADSRLRYR